MKASTIVNVSTKGAFTTLSLSTEQEGVTNDVIVNKSFVDKWSPGVGKTLIEFINGTKICLDSQTIAELREHLGLGEKIIDEVVADTVEKYVDPIVGGGWFSNSIRSFLERVKFW